MAGTDGEARILRYITIGAGNRGNVYAWYALENPERAQVSSKNLQTIAHPIRHCCCTTGCWCC